MISKSQKIYSGYGACEKLRDILKHFSPRKVFFVTGKKSYFSSGVENLLGKIIDEFDYLRFFDFQTNPKLEDVKTATELFNTEKCDFVIGVGGGSVMDIAKAVALLATQQDKFEELFKGTVPIEQRQIPSVMIPTTAGTGSESTHFSVVYIDKVKYSLAHSSLLPDYAVLDPVFTETLPAYITACTALDALCQAIESFWSVNSTEESREYSGQSIKLVMADIVKCVNNPDKKSRENMLMSSNLAGRAINIAKTTAAHALSYPLTSHFNIPHGYAVALTLPYFVEFNNNVSQKNLQDNRGIEFVKDRMTELLDILGVSTADKGREKIINIMKEIKLETSLSALGIDKNVAEVIIQKGLDPQRLKNNPKLVCKTDLDTLIPW